MAKWMSALCCASLCVGNIFGHAPQAKRISYMSKRMLDQKFSINKYVIAQRLTPGTTASLVAEKGGFLDKLHGVKTGHGLCNLISASQLQAQHRLKKEGASQRVIDKAGKSHDMLLKLVVPSSWRAMRRACYEYRTHSP